MLDPVDVEVHLATCAGCAGELARYREVLGAVSSLRYELESPPEGFRDRVVGAAVSYPAALRSRVVRFAADRRIRVAAASLGGAVVGAGAIAILWWRVGRRAVVGGQRV